MQKCNTSCYCVCNSMWHRSRCCSFLWFICCRRHQSPCYLANNNRICTGKKLLNVHLNKVQGTVTITFYFGSITIAEGWKSLVIFKLGRGSHLLPLETHSWTCLSQTRTTSYSTATYILNNLLNLNWMIRTDADVLLKPNIFQLCSQNMLFYVIRLDCQALCFML